MPEGSFFVTKLNGYRHFESTNTTDRRDIPESFLQGMCRRSVLFLLPSVQSSSTSGNQHPFNSCEREKAQKKFDK